MLFFLFARGGGEGDVVFLVSFFIELLFEFERARDRPAEEEGGGDGERAAAGEAPPAWMCGESGGNLS